MRFLHLYVFTCVPGKIRGEFRRFERAKGICSNRQGSPCILVQVVVSLSIPSFRSIATICPGMEVLFNKRAGVFY